jgi:MoaA/NifB/PqqE/SkfB family radical SAM enzyme
MKKLLLDFVYAYETCNFRCGYCSSRKTATSVGSEEALRMKRNLDAALASLTDSFLIYRFSGGEIFLAEEVLESLLERSFPVTQLLTNGTLLSDALLDRLASVRERVVIGVSLDGHTVAMNRMRQSASGMTEPTLRRILGHLSSLLTVGVPVEIQTVVSEANCSGLSAFLDFLLDAYPRENLLVSLFPVRPLAGKLDGADFVKILSRYDRYRQILPSRDYLEGLVHCLEKGRRDPCRVPEHISFRVLRDASSPVPNLVRYFCECGGLRYVYDSGCSSCYTHYDLYNSILAGATSASSIPFPLFRNPLIRSYFRETAKRRKRPGNLVRLISSGKARILGNRL